MSQSEHKKKAAFSKKMSISSNNLNAKLNKANNNNKTSKKQEKQHHQSTKNSSQLAIDKLALSKLNAQSNAELSSSSSFLALSFKSVRTKLSNGAELFKNKLNKISRINPEIKLLHQHADTKANVKAIDKVKSQSDEDDEDDDDPKAPHDLAMFRVSKSDEVASFSAKLSRSSSVSSKRDFSSKLESLVESKFESETMQDLANTNKTTDENIYYNDLNLLNFDLSMQTTDSFNLEMLINQDLEKLCTNSTFNFNNEENIYDAAISKLQQEEKPDDTSSPLCEHREPFDLLDESSIIDNNNHKLNNLNHSNSDNKEEDEQEENKCDYYDNKPNNLVKMNTNEYVSVQLSQRLSENNYSNLSQDDENNLDDKQSNMSNKSEHSISKQQSLEKMVGSESNIDAKSTDISSSISSSVSNTNYMNKFTSKLFRVFSNKTEQSIESVSSAFLNSSTSNLSISKPSEIKSPFLFERAKQVKHSYEYDKIPLYQSYDELASKSETNIGKRASNYIELFSYSLWSKLPIVIESGLLAKMTRKEIELQERWFEILTSELSYYKTLLILNDIIINECKPILKPYDLNLVFSKHLATFINLSEELIDSLQQRFEQSILIRNFFDVLENVIYQDKFDFYVNYASEQVSQKEHFDRLMKSNKKFSELVNKLLYDPRLQGKDVSSFLIAPIQRLPRYKLLIDAIVKILPQSDADLVKSGLELSNSLQMLLKKANEKVTKFLMYTETIKLQVLLKYDSKDLMITDLVSPRRQLLYHGDLVSSMSIESNSRKSTGNNNRDSQLFNNRKAKKESLIFTTSAIGTNQHSSKHQIYHLILFNDLLLITLKEFNEDKSFNYRVLEVVNNGENIYADLSEMKQSNEIIGDLHSLPMSITTDNSTFYFINSSINTLSCSSISTSTSSTPSTSTTSSTSSTALAPHHNHHHHSSISTTLNHHQQQQQQHKSYLLTLTIKKEERIKLKSNNFIYKNPYNTIKYFFVCNKSEGDIWKKYLDQMFS